MIQPPAVSFMDERADARAGRARPNVPMARLVSVGSALPELCWPQQAVAERMAEVWQLKGAALERWRRIIAGTSIEQRHGVVTFEDVMRCSTAQRMELYERFAPVLAETAAQRAIGKAGIPPSAITDLIVVSCTGFSAPGLDVALLDRLGLNANVRRTMIGFMGCFGAINGLRAARGACAADPEAVVLVVSCELCSLHMRMDASAQNQVASALFADGAAAAVVVGANVSCEGCDPPTDGGQTAANEAVGALTNGAALLLAEGRDWMTWRITDAGFAMTLSRDVPVALRQALDKFVKRSYPRRPACFAIHPGGPGILDAADAALGLNGSQGLEASRAVLARCGNLSSATVLLVLEEALARGYGPPMLMLAFGPGLTIESLMVERA